jgi:HAD superfamily hydrolase (TIGR01509 family)
MIRAVLWDVDGTLAETERDGHRVAFNRAFAATGLGWRWDEAYYGELLRVTGGRERLLADMATRRDAPADSSDRASLAQELHDLKNRHYAELIGAGCIPLRPGVRPLIEEIARCGLTQAIVTTTSRSNVDALLGHHFGPNWQERFAATVCGEDVRRKKPDPEAYLRALQVLDLQPHETLALEDSALGAAAAAAARVPMLLTRSAYFGQDVSAAAIAIGAGLHSRGGWTPAPAADADAQGSVTLSDLVDWHAHYLAARPSIRGQAAPAAAATPKRST